MFSNVSLNFQAQKLPILVVCTRKAQIVVYYVRQDINC